MVVSDTETVIAALLERADRAGVFVDFDGTLAEIVDEPSEARPVAGSPEVLRDLAGYGTRVAVLSGRPLDFLQQYFEPPVVLSGLYGLEVQRADGRRIDHPQGGAWREVVDDVAACLESHHIDGMRVEPKGLSLTLHYRGRPEVADTVRQEAEAQAARSGLTVRSARMSYELHPPIAADKGTALLELADDLEVVLYVGDDVGDLPAFDALDQLEDRGVDCLRVVVDSTELDPELRGRADLILPGPTGVVSLLGTLLDRVRPRAS